MNEDIKESIEVLNTVANKFENGEYKWGKGNYRDTKERMCMMGAIYYTVNQKNITKQSIKALAHSCPKQEAVHLLYQVFKEENKGGYTLTMWNDDPVRRKRDVIRFLRKAVKHASQKEAAKTI